MDKINVNICRLCLNFIEDTNFMLLKGLPVQMMKTVFVDLNLSITTNPVICSKCVEILQKCFDFKMTCLSTEDHVKSFRANMSDPVEVNLEDICSKIIFENGEVCKREKICRLCLSLDNDYYESVNEYLEGRSLRDMLKNCVPELDLDLTNEPLICEICLDLLKKQFNFMTYCMELEKKIQIYCDFKWNLDSSSSIDLNSIRQFFDGIKTENDTATEIINIQDTTRPTIFLKSEAHCEMLNTEELILSDSVDLKMECNSGNEGYNGEEDEMNLQHDDKQSNDTNVKSVDMKEDKNPTENVNESISLEVGQQKIFNCKECDFKSKWKKNFKKHMLLHNPTNLLEVESFVCIECDFQTRWKRSLKQHMLLHNPSDVTYKCDKCNYSTKMYSYFKKHAKRHEPISVRQQKIFNCKECDFKSRWKKNLKTHMLLHNPSNLAHKCKECNYITRSDYAFKVHSKVHKDISEVESFVCKECDFQTRWKRSLNHHMLLHNPSEVTYKCDKCNYSTKMYSYFKRHAKYHIGVSELTMLKCNNCNFQTRWKLSLERHMLLQHNSSAVRYKCEECDFSTKILIRLKKHGKIHKDSSDHTGIFRCNDCDFQSKWKDSIRNHVLIHIKERMKKNTDFKDTLPS